MSRPISQMTAGEVVYINETVHGTTSYIPYLFLGINEISFTLSCFVLSLFVVQFLRISCSLSRAPSKYITFFTLCQYLFSKFFRFFRIFFCFFEKLSKKAPTLHFAHQKMPTWRIACLSSHYERSSFTQF